jgi:diguanylate cyclase (GGDEF)-like protein
MSRTDCVKGAGQASTLAKVRSVNDAIGQEEALSRADRDREVVQRTAELLASNLPLEELFQAVCLLLARFVDASAVFIALKDAQGGRIAYMLENGVVGALDNRRVRPGSATDTVLHTGQPVLKRTLADWTEGRHPLNLPDQPQKDERISAIFVPLKFGAKTIGVLSVQSNAGEAYDEEDVDLLQTCALYLSVRINQAQLETQSARLENIASTDSLTGVPNRRAFNEHFSSEWRRAIRRGSMLALVLLDVDFFKPFNDTYGHVAGDAALQQVANTLSACLGRSIDFFARYGGEEFVAVLPDTNLTGALTIAERMREAVYELGIAHSGSVLQRLTISIGVACLIPARGTSSESLVKAADTALYQAKRGGRNRVAAENYRSDAPPAYATKAYRHNLPVVRGRTFGRAQHLHQIRKLLRTSRLLSIVGPAGIGKSREAIEAAQREIGRFADGACYVDCSTVTDERYLANKVASILGVPETPLSPATSIVAEYLRAKKVLIVLDNCDGVSNACAQYAAAMIAQTPDVRILTTSREPMLVAGEVAFVLPPLSPADAAALFLERAHVLGHLETEKTNKHLVERVCNHLAGVPRAIQLAASQLQSFGLAELERRLRDQTAFMHDAAQGFVEWSYDVLTPEEQELIQTLSVFAGGATREAIADVCGCSGALNALVDKGLVNAEAVKGVQRYILPGSIRTFAQERLRDSGRWHDVSMRHVRYYCERARALEESFATTQWGGNFAAMAPELDNLRAALIYTVTQKQDLQMGARLSCDLINYWQQMGRATAGREWVEKLLERDDVSFPDAVRAKLLYGVARLDNARSKHALDAALQSAELYRSLGDEAGLSAALFEAAAAYSGLGDIDAADPVLQESLEISTRIGNVRRMADALNGMAVAEQWRDHPKRAQELLEQSLALFRKLEDDRGVASLLGNLGDLAATVGEYDRAVELSRQSLAILERLHDPQSTGWQLLNLGAFELKRHNLDAARPALRRALDLVREYQDEWLSANCVDALARLALAEKDWTRALRLAAFASASFESIGVPRQPPDQLDYEHLVREAKVAVGPNTADKQIARARKMTWPDVLKEVEEI